MRTPIGIRRLVCGIVATAAILALASIAWGGIQFARPHETSEFIASDPIWSLVPHPTRTAEINVRIVRVNDPFQASTFGFAAELHYDFTLRDDDPLLPLVTSGAISAPDLVKRLAGGVGDAEDSSVTVRRSRGGLAHVEVETKLSSTGGSATREQARLTVRLEDTDYKDLNFPDVLPRPESIVSQRTISVDSGEGTIVAVDGERVVEQDAKSVKFDGSPSDASVTVDLKNPLYDAGPDIARTRPFYFLNVNDHGQFWLAGVTLCAPWLALMMVLMPARSRISSGPAEQFFWVTGLQVAIGTLALLVIVSLWGSDDAPWPDGIGAAVIAVTALFIAARGRVAQGLSGWDPAIWRRLPLISALLLVIALPGVENDFLGIEAIEVSAASLVGAGLVAVIIATAAGAYRQDRFWAGLAVAVYFAAWILISPSLSDGLNLRTFTLVCFLGISFAAPIALLLRLGRVPYSPVRKWPLRLAGALLFLPLVAMLTGYPYYGNLGSSLNGLHNSIVLLNATLIGATLVISRRRGHDAKAMADRLVWALSLASVLIVATRAERLPQFNALSAAWLIVAWAIAAPLSRQVRAVTLAQASPSTHRKLFAAETRRRMMELSAHDFYRAARGRLREGAINIREYKNQQQRFDNAATAHGKTVAGVPVEDALATTAGISPTNNAKAAALYAAPLVIALAGYEWWALATSLPQTIVGAPVVELAGIALRTLRWLGYACIYGYFYTLLRGRTPVAKATVLILVVLPAEWLSVLSSINPNGRQPEGAGIATLPELFLACAIRAGQVVVFFTVLGLAWERRLAGEAGFRWDRIRNVRSLRALGTPAGTVVVAVATAFGTAVASAAVAALLANGPQAPANTSPPTPSITTSPAAPAGR
ncbi:MAG: hypothetical protein ABW022_28395 [Actinoplanes sp.]